MKKSNTSISDRIMSKITDEHISPKPRWEFLVHRYAVWGASLTAILIGGLAVSGALFVSIHSGYEMYLATHRSFGSFIFSSLPYLWIVALILFASVAYYNIRHTEGGYKYSFSVLLAGVMICSIALGAGLFILGVGKVTDEKMAHIAPFYKPVATLQREHWESPLDGRLAGMIEHGAGSLTVQTFSGRVYHIDTSDLRAPDLAVIERSGTVRIVGVATTSGTAFHACFIMPWENISDDVDVQKQKQPKGRMAYSRIQENTPRSSECQSIRPFNQMERLQKNR